MVIISLIRRRRVPDDEQFYVNFWGKTKSSKVISVILLILILAGSSSAVYIDYTYQGVIDKFYILGPGGSATDYPTNLTVGQQGSVIIEIINNEGKSADYNIVVASNGTKISELNVTVSNGAQTEIPYNFTASTADIKILSSCCINYPKTQQMFTDLLLCLLVSLKKIQKEYLFRKNEIINFELTLFFIKSKI